MSLFLKSAGFKEKTVYNSIFQMDYRSGKIYCIRNTVDDDIYVGATCQPQSKRMAEHRLKARQQSCSHVLICKKIKDVGVENFYIELVESCPCNSVDELEGEHIRRIGTLNKTISGRTTKMYVAEHYEKTQAYLKQYREDHKEETREYKRNYFQENKEQLLKRCMCECGKYYNEPTGSIIIIIFYIWLI